MNIHIQNNLNCSIASQLKKLFQQKPGSLLSRIRRHLLYILFCDLFKITGSSFPVVFTTTNDLKAQS